MLSKFTYTYYSESKKQTVVEEVYVNMQYIVSMRMIENNGLSYIILVNTRGDNQWIDNVKHNLDKIDIQ